MSRRLENNRSRRARIIAEARALVTDGGFERLSMRKLAAAAGISVPTLYNYFSSKEDIRLALEAEGMDEMDRRLEAIPLKRPLERAHAVITVATDYLRENEAECRASLLAGASAPSGHQGEAIARRATAMLSVAIEAAMTAGLLKPDLSAERLARQSYEMFIFAARRWAAGDLPLTDVANRSLYALYSGLLGVATPESARTILAMLRRLEKGRFPKRFAA